MLQFDQNGYLVPYEVQDVSLDEFQRIFVENFPASDTRKHLFDHYLDWVFDFQRDIFPYFTQWINGSFVTQKLNPKDIDFVTFLDGRVYEMKERRGALDKFWSFSNEDRGLDAYILPDFPSDNPKFENFERYKRDWTIRYSRARKGETLMNEQKGFVQLIFQK